MKKLNNKTMKTKKQSQATDVKTDVIPSRIVFGVGNTNVTENELLLKFRASENNFQHPVKLIILSGVISGMISNPRLTILNNDFRNNYDISMNVRKYGSMEQYIVTYIISLRDTAFPIQDAQGIDDYFFEIKYDIAPGGYGYGANPYHCNVLSTNNLLADTVLFNS